MRVCEKRGFCRKSAKHRRNQGADQKHPSCDTPGDAAADHRKFRAPFGPAHCGPWRAVLKEKLVYLTIKSVLFSMVFVSFSYLCYFSNNHKFKSIPFFKSPIYYAVVF